MRAWIRAKSSQAFKVNGVINGDRFRRTSIGCDSNHPLVEDLKLKDFLAMTTLSEEDACSKRAMNRYLRINGTVTCPVARLATGLRVYA